MKPFSTVAVLKHPRDQVYLAIRDRLPALADRIADIRSIETEQRTEQADGRVELVNTWRVDATVPAVLRGVIAQDQLAWTDRASWDPASWACTWRIEPHLHPDRVRCAGTTTFEPAMAGRGTRLTFAGSFEVVGSIPGVPALIQGPAAAALEALVGGTIPRSFRRMVDVVQAELG